jgi:transposase
MAGFAFRSEIEVLSAADGVRRRHWSGADKIRIVEESLVGHREAGATARRHGISRSLLTTGRRQFRKGEAGAMRTPMFTPRAVAATPPTSACDIGLRHRPATSACEPPAASSPVNRVEIVLLNGRRRVVPVDMDPEALARLLPIVDRA